MENSIKNKSNSELNKMKQELKSEFEKVRVELIKIYDYWVAIEKKHNEIEEELNDRFGVNNK